MHITMTQNTRRAEHQSDNYTLKTMNKISILALGLAIALSSCGSGDKNDSDNDSLVSKSLSDSISTEYGLMAGGFVANELSIYARETGEAYDNAEFMKGVSSIINAAKSDAYLAGVTTGMRVMQDIKQMESQGVQINRDKIIEMMQQQILADSVNMDDTHSASERYSNMMDRVSEQARAREEARKAAEPEAIKNIKSAEAYILKLQKENPKLQKSESGLYYIIETPGEGERVKATDRVSVKYVGKHLDG